MAGKQIDFPPMQTHRRSFEIGMIVFSVICIVIVLFVIFGTDIGNEFRPKA